MSKIKITSSHRREEDGMTEYTGELLAFPGWTFEATVADQPLTNSDCWPCLEGPIASFSLIHNGGLYYTCPGDDYDGHDVPLHAEHEVMIQQIDGHFPPSRSERDRFYADREEQINGLVAHIEQLLDDPVVKASADDVLDTALRRVRNNTRR